MMEMKERMVAMEESLRRKEAELAAIRAAEEKEEARNAGRVDELQSYVKELEAAIQDRREEDDGMLADLKAALEASRKELAEFKTRADEAEVRVFILFFTHRVRLSALSLSPTKQGSFERIVSRNNDIDFSHFLDTRKRGRRGGSSPDRRFD